MKTACFIGHRNIKPSFQLKNDILEYLDYLIKDRGVQIFLFGSMSNFNDFCYYAVCLLKRKYPFIKRIYYRSSFQYISKEYEEYILQHYEETIYPEECINSNKLSYIKRNQTMINKSDFCIFYYNKDYQPPKKSPSKKNLFPHQSKSGTAIAYNYAISKQKEVKNFYLEKSLQPKP